MPQGPPSADTAGVVALAGGPAGLVYAFAAVVAVVSTAFLPAQSALIPTLARDPSELTAANVASSTIESVAFFAGPALGGLLLAATSVGVVFAAQAAVRALPVAMILREDLSVVMESEIDPEREFLLPPQDAIEQAKDGEVVLIAPGISNQESFMPRVAAAMKRAHAGTATTLANPRFMMGRGLS